MKRVMEFPKLEIRIAGQESATRLKDKQLLQMLVFFAITRDVGTEPLGHIKCAVNQLPTTYLIGSHRRCDAGGRVSFGKTPLLVCCKFGVCKGPKQAYTRSVTFRYI